jgi:hypothetical protein
MRTRRYRRVEHMGVAQRRGRRMGRSVPYEVKDERGYHDLISLARPVSKVVWARKNVPVGGLQWAGRRGLRQPALSLLREAGHVSERSAYPCLCPTYGGDRYGDREPRGEVDCMRPTVFILVKQGTGGF